MRKFLICLLTLCLLATAIPAARAADMNSCAGAVTTDGAALNVRASASASSAVVATLRKGSYITLLSRSSSWWKVEYGKNRYGYCHADYITPVQGTAAFVTAETALNVRTGPGTNHTRQATLNRAEAVLRLTEASGWSRILYHGTKTGYVSSRYLSSSPQGSDGVKLSVPNFKQTDSRWGSVPIGTSGKTMAQIGCATTAIAMMESCRTGTTVYPDAMAKRLQYTSTGSVYWPAHYTVTATLNLSRVLALLRQGKPVLFGAKNAYGTQHWVVITGFSGGALTAANFTVNDPGSGSRTNLQQFLDAYPNFYKYFHY